MTRMALSVRSTWLPAISLAFILAAPAAGAQQSTPATPRRQSSATTDTAVYPDMPGSGTRDSEQSRMLREMSRDRNKLRQKEIVEDTNHLMDLVRQLKDAVDKSNKDQLSLSVV
ncbi:MAG TPA: hypothetical protein VHE33_05760, partial [Acidobacteriaceae bacterium]|nr:hypothetical protein [Acidobacteriaceae bacterium]